MAVMMRSSCMVLAFAIVKGARVDDNEAANPISLKQAIKPDGSPETIMEKAAAGIPEAVKAIKDAKEASDLIGPPQVAEVSKADLKCAEDEAAVDTFQKDKTDDKNEAEKQLATQAAEAAAAKAKAAGDHLQLMKLTRADAVAKQKLAALKLDEAEVMHQTGTQEKFASQSSALASATSAAGALKAFENSKTFKDESETKLADSAKTAETAKATNDVAENKLVHVYKMKSYADKEVADSQSMARDAAEGLNAASLSYDKQYAIHSKIVPMVSSTMVISHAASEAEAIATDKAFAAMHEAETSKDQATKDAGKAEESTKEAEQTFSQVTQEAASEPQVA